MACGQLRRLLFIGALVAVWSALGAYCGTPFTPLNLVVNLVDLNGPSNALHTLYIVEYNPDTSTTVQTITLPSKAGASGLCTLSSRVSYVGNLELVLPTKIVFACANAAFNTTASSETIAIVDLSTGDVDTTSTTFAIHGTYNVFGVTTNDTIHFWFTDNAGQLSYMLQGSTPVGIANLNYPFSLSLFDNTLYAVYSAPGTILSQYYPLPTTPNPTSSLASAQFGLTNVYVDIDSDGVPDLVYGVSSTSLYKVSRSGSTWTSCGSFQIDSGNTYVDIVAYYDSALSGYVIYVARSLAIVKLVDSAIPNATISITFNGVVYTAPTARFILGLSRYPIPSPSSSPSGSLSASNTPSNLASISPSQSPSVSASTSYTASSSPSTSLTASLMPSISITPSQPPSASPSQSVGPSPSQLVSTSAKPSISPSNPVSPSPSASPSHNNDASVASGLAGLLPDALALCY